MIFPAMQGSPSHQSTASPAGAAKFPDSVTVTTLGPWPGTDPVEAAKVGLGLLSEPHLPALASLPARGVGSDAVGRTAAMLVELPVDVQPYGWRFVDRPGQDFRRATSALSTDINVLADVVGAGELVPAELKIHLTGPFSLAAAIHLHYGERALSDAGARRDIAQSLVAGLPTLVEKVRAGVPGAALTLQIDEPEIAAILAGAIPTASGYRTLRSIPGTEVRQTWAAFVAAAKEAGFAQVALNLAPATESADAHNTAWRKGLGLALESGLDHIGVPLNLLEPGHWEQLAGAIEAGMGVWAGTVPARPGQVPLSYELLVEKIMVPWRSLGLEISRLNQLRITPAGPMEQLSPGEARSVLERALEVAEELTAIRYR